MSWTLIVLAVPPLVAVLAALGGPGLARCATVLGAVACLGLVIAIATTVEHGRTLQAAGGWLRVDLLGAVFLLATGLLYAMAAIFSIGYLQTATSRSPADSRHFARSYRARRHRGFDLIVCGHHHARRAGRLLLHDVAETLFREACTPVLVMGQGSR
ncbi:MAG: universal stress protein [Solirubrobacteraceae bacterium]